MIRQKLAAAWILFLVAAGPAYALDLGRYGPVKVVESVGKTRGVVIFFTDHKGFAETNNSDARAIARAGALVAEIDSPAYLKKIDQTKEKCHPLVADVEWLSRGLQRERKFPNYFTPIVAGIGEGGTLAELTLEQAMAATIAGAVSLNPSEVIPSLRPVCAPIVKGSLGFQYALPMKLPGFWVVGLTEDASSSSHNYVAGLKRAGAPVEVQEFAPSYKQADALRALIEPHLATPPKITSDISALPLAELPVAYPSDRMAVVLSGDGGWRDLDKTIAEDLQRSGIPVVGWDSLRYFWSEKTPAQTTKDLSAVIETFMDRWGANKVALIGYSFGADVLPFAFNRFSPALRSHVVLIAMLGLSKSADFEITVSGWLGEPPGPNALPVIPQTDRIPAGLMQCFYGQDESDTACPTLARRGVTTIKTPGGHHFNGDYDALAQRILAAFDRRIAHASSGTQ